MENLELGSYDIEALEESVPSFGGSIDRRCGECHGRCSFTLLKNLNPLSL